jgi:AbiU2
MDASSEWEPAMTDRLQEVETAMGKDLGATYYHIMNHIVILRISWQDYLDLFGTNPERIGILNEAAGPFMGRLQHRLYEAAVLGICRLTDKDESRGGYERLSILKLKSQVPKEKVELLRRANAAVMKALKLAEPCRDLRDALYAHADYKVAIGQFQRPSAPDRKHIGEALDALSDVVKLLWHEYFSAELYLSQDSIDGQRSALDLLLTVDDGLKFDKFRHQAAVENRMPTRADLLSRSRSWQ